MTFTTRHATIDDLDGLTSLFDAYRQFYGQASDLRLAREFLSDRFRHQQSVVLLAEDASGRPLGFTQLYPGFSSVRVSRTFVLNDLFVVPDARRQGVAQALLTKAAEVGRALGAVRLSLSTAHDNEQARRLYDSQGWKRDELFVHYGLAL